MSKKTKNTTEEQHNDEVKQETSTEQTAVDNTEKASEQSENQEDIITSLQAQVDEQKDKYLRLFADFDNYKKRNAKERLDLLQTAGKDVILTIIPTLDDLNRAIQSMETAADIQAVKEGMLLVKNKLFNALEQKGLKPMQSIGTDFNPDFHEALTKIPAPNAEMKGKVIDEIETGYTLNDKIIRYAKVVVGE